MSVMRWKVCRTCGVEKPLRQFYRHPNYADGHMSDCKDCKRAYQRELGALKRDAYRPRRKAYAARPEQRARRAAYQRSERGKEVRRFTYRVARALGRKWAYHGKEVRA